jgi:hypothetical protein
MRYYVESWLKKALINITEENQEVAVTTSPKTAIQENTKGALEGK